MKKLVLATLILTTITAGAQGFITKRVKVARQQAEVAVNRAKTRGVTERLGQFFVNCKANSDARLVSEKLRAQGAKIRGVIDGIVLMEAPFSKIEDLAAVEGVVKIDVGPMVSKQTDITRNATHASDVISGTGEKLPQAYTGKGVMVGIYDIGFDPTHPMLKDKDGNLRVKGYFAGGMQNLGEQVVIGPDTLYGSALYKPEDILDTLKVKVDGESHGTHCITIAAGSTIDDVKGLAGQPIGGMAPEADILITTDDRLDQNFWNYIDENDLSPDPFLLSQSLAFLKHEADKAKKPLVISLSINSIAGWHDGTSDVARILKYYAKDMNIPFVISTGNSGIQNTMPYLNMKTMAYDTLSVHLRNGGLLWGGMKTKKNVRFGISIVSGIDGHVYYQTPFAYNSYPNVDEHGDGITFNIGQNADNSNLDSFDKEVADSLMKYIQGEGSIDMWCVQDMAFDQNGEEYLYTCLYFRANDIKFNKFKFNNGTEEVEDILQLKLSMIPSEDTELHAWSTGNCEKYLCGQINSGELVPGNTSISVMDWNSSGETVSIGAWTANDKKKGLDDTGYSKYSYAVIGDYAYFTSYGTDLAGHKHPNVCAPGFSVLAGLNSFDSSLTNSDIFEKKAYSNQYTGQDSPREYAWGFMSGTSMSTPAAAGVVALWLQAAADMGKTLSNSDIKEIIRNTSDNDEFTENSPERFGEGKINAYKGLLYVLGLYTGIPALSKEQPKGVNFSVQGNMVYANGAVDGTEVTLYNLQGVAVKQTTVQGGAISLETLPKGVYALQLGNQGSTLIRY